MAAHPQIEPMRLILFTSWVTKLIELLHWIWRIGISIHTSAKTCVWNTIVYMP
jgi:hypothetical protein